MTVEYICEGGHGSEATIEVQLRTEFPGIGGTISTYQAIPVAWRKEHHVSPDTLKALRAVTETLCESEEFRAAVMRRIKQSAR